jgi:hypothetical protein
MPYSDKKAMRGNVGPPPLDITVKIQVWDSEGWSRDRIHEALRDHSVTLEQISRVLDPKAEQVDASRPRRPERANLGHAHMKQRFRG